MNLWELSFLIFLHYGSVRTLEISHVCPDIRVQRIDDHFAICRASDLHTPINEAWRWWCALPCIVLADVLGFGEEVEKVSLVELGLPDYSSLKQRFPALVECAVEERKEDTSVLAEDVTVLVVEITEDVDLAQDGIGIGSHDEV
jgi:hypothetical protein